MSWLHWRAFFGQTEIQRIQEIQRDSSVLFGVSFDTRMISIVGLLLFTGITAWDIQRMNKILYLSNGDVVSQEKIAIYMALELYLDFLNIFLYILRLLGYNRD